ncbi:Phosphatidylinositol N-acetylglucosaminyltransferase GPI3 subunit [Sorochytrium milnesiophthora]
MVSDFFYPNVGGVESHIYCLSQCLIARGHKVIVVTHAYGNRKGVRWLSNGLKVYYLPHPIVYQQASFPTIYTLFPLLRSVFVRERVDTVHGHQAFSSMCHEALLHAHTMGLRTCFTDHSLFGFADTSSILTNKLLRFTLSDVDHVICVSHTSKENTVLRASIEPSLVSVVPNAVVASQFEPDPSCRSSTAITIVVVSRLVYRKGTDLLTRIVPRVCAAHPTVQFLIAGDGNKRVDLEQMREKYTLQDRVELLGAVRHDDVRKVGGVPEVLPSHMITFAEPDVNDLVKAITRAINKLQFQQVDPRHFHHEIRDMYNWEDVAARTERIYTQVHGRQHAPQEMRARLQRFFARGGGVWAGTIFAVVVAIDYLLMMVLQRIWPWQEMDVAPEYPRRATQEDQQGESVGALAVGKRET